MSRRKPLAALAAATAALALAIPAASASAATFPVYTPPHYLCSTLIWQIEGADAVGNHLLANLISQTFVDIHCGGAAI